MARRVASYNESPPPPLYDCEGTERRVGARASSETEKFRVRSEALTKGSVYGNSILIRIVDPGNRTRCDLFHLRCVVSVAGYFVDTSGGYSDVDPCWNIQFVARTGTRGLKCVSELCSNRRSAITRTSQRRIIIWGSRFGSRDRGITRRRFNKGHPTKTEHARDL